MASLRKWVLTKHGIHSVFLIFGSALRALLYLFIFKKESEKKWIDKNEKRVKNLNCTKTKKYRLYKKHNIIFIIISFNYLIWSTKSHLYYCRASITNCQSAGSIFCSIAAWLCDKCLMTCRVYSTNWLDLPRVSSVCLKV